MKKIALVSAYFGKLPAYFPLWLRSCEYNPTIDFYIFTNDRTFYKDVPNIKFVFMTFDELKRLAQQNYDFPISLDRPYKLCDFKVAYGEIFKHWLNGYDFWGHCDLDQLMGNIRSFVNDEMLNSYDKIFNYGHLTIYRNNNYINSLYRHSKEMGWRPYEDVLSCPIDYAFDEVGMCHILSNCSTVRHFDRMCGMDIQWNDNYLKVEPHESKFVNSKKQIFYWEDGNVYQLQHLEDGNIKIDNAAYIHFGHRKMSYPAADFTDNNVGVYLTHNSFVPKYNTDLPTIDEIQRLNPYPGFFKEKANDIKVFIFDIAIHKIKRKGKLLWKEIKNNAHGVR